jgi:hypothetical protein
MTPDDSPPRKALRSSGVDMSGGRGAIERADFLIDRFRVRYAFGGGWTCRCAEFVAREACKHTREAAGRHAAQAKIALHLKSGSAGTFTIHARAHGR